MAGRMHAIPHPSSMRAVISPEAWQLLPLGEGSPSSSEHSESSVLDALLLPLLLLLSLRLLSQSLRLPLLLLSTLSTPPSTLDAGVAHAGVTKPVLPPPHWAGPGTPKDGSSPSKAGVSSGSPAPGAAAVVAA